MVNLIITIKTDFNCCANLMHTVGNIIKQLKHLKTSVKFILADLIVLYADVKLESKSS